MNQATGVEPKGDEKSHELMLKLTLESLTVKFQFHVAGDNEKVKFVAQIVSCLFMQKDNK